MPKLFAFAPSLVCAVFAGSLAWRGDAAGSGWGWFLFAAIVLAQLGAMATASGDR